LTRFGDGPAIDLVAAAVVVVRCCDQCATGVAGCAVGVPGEHVGEELVVEGLGGAEDKGGAAGGCRLAKLVLR